MAIEGTPLHAEDDADSNESRRSKAKKPEAIGLLAVETKPSGQRSPERIGHVLVNSEAKPDERRRKAMSETIGASMAAEKKMKIENDATPSTGKRIDTISRAELMDLAEKVIIDGSSLRQIYETHLIGERGLRRLVAEHMHGGDLRKALRNEVLEREMDFERDPAMRDLAVSSAAPTSRSNAALEKLLQKAAVSVADSGEEAAFFKARARYDAVHHQQQHQKQRRLIDISLFVIIITLVVMVIIMYLARR
jgi:hypothetical protein